MKRAIFLLLVLLSLPVVGAAFTTFVGAGAIRSGDPSIVTVCALILVLLPGLGLAVAMPKGYRASATALGATAWSFGCLVAFPLYFPEERGQSLATGLAITGVPNAALPFVAALERDFPAIEQSRKPPAEARPVSVGPLRESRKAKVELPFDKRDNALIVPVTFVGKNKEVFSKRMLLDTGASLTTLSRHALEELGVELPDKGNTVTLATASGEIKAPISIVGEMNLDVGALRDVTVAACDACETKDFAGLLGLNVLEQFLLTVDHQARRVLLEPRPPASDRLGDIAPWAEVKASAKQWIDGRAEVELRMSSGAPITIRKAEVAIHCSSSFVAELSEVPAKGEAVTAVTLPRGVTCDSYTVNITRATW